MKNTNHFLFGFSQRVQRRPYLVSGVLLIILKYLGESLLYWLARGSWLGPLHFLSPLLSYRYPDFRLMPDWFAPIVVFWSLPFIWIGTGMSIRRSADAGLTPWLGILFFVPGLNYLLMLALSVLPSSPHGHWEFRELEIQNSQIRLPLLTTIGFAFAGTLVAWICTNHFNVYAISLFVGGPLILGLVLGFLLNHKTSIGLRRTLFYGFVAIGLIHLMLLIFALEGVICLLMSLPICSCLGVIGAGFGFAIATHSRGGKSQTMVPLMMVVALPLLPFAEKHLTTITHSDMVLSSVEINSPPERVWPNVVKFSDLPLTHNVLFRLGVAYPIRARIEGQGVGAVRRCEFSTGAFVEPITAWEEPGRLAFDVLYQPQPMKEVSFYDHVNAPHLNGYFRSVRGEFRLLKTAEGKTRLEGRTWYEVDMQPGWYWQIYGRWFIHNIHMRVLDHIRNLSENRTEG